MPQLIDAILRPLGLITQPNKLGYYDPGALRTASGVYLRDPGVLTTQTQFVQQIAGPWNGAASAFILVPVDRYSSSKYLTFYLNPDVIWRWSLDNTSQGTITYTMVPGVSSAESFQSGTGYGRIGGWSINGQRLVVPGVTATHVFDLTSGGAPVPRPGGLTAPAIRTESSSGTTGYLAVGKHVHYTAVLRRTLSDGVELVSAPAAAVQSLNLAGSPVNKSLVIRVGSRTKIGDYLDIYRTKVQTQSVNTGSDYYLCSSVKMTANGSQTIVVVDSCSDENVGQALYTNSGVRGAAAANMPPPICKNVCTFKGYTFFRSPTDLPSITLRIGTGMFNVVDGTSAVANFRANGIGSRNVTGNCTLGGNQITGVSAADMVGIVVGQHYTGDVVFTSSAMNVSAVNAGAGTITFSGGTWLSNAAATVFRICDIMELDGATAELSFFNRINDFIGFNGYDDIEYLSCLDRVLPPTALTAVSAANGTIPADSFTIARPYQTNNTLSAASMTIRATNGANYTPPLPRIELSEAAQTIAAVVRKNMIRWSEQNNVDACPLANQAFVGNGELYAAFAMRDCMLIFASDGAWRLSGTGGQAGSGYDWRLDPIDSTLILSGPRCGCVARDTFYGYTNRGFVSVDSSGNVREISQGRVQDLMPGPPWSDTQAACVFFDETNDEVIIKTELSTVLYVYNVLTDAFTTLLPGATFFDGAYIRGDQRIALISGNGIYAQSGGFVGVASQVDYQPTYGDNPFAIQQWQSMDLVFDSASEGLSVTPRFNAAVGGTARALNDRGNDQARASFGVGRNTPAKATCIAPGWSISAGLAQMRFFGAALRKVPITVQRTQR